MSKYTRRVFVRNHLPGSPKQEWSADAEVEISDNHDRIKITVHLHDGGYLILEVK